MSHYLVGVDVGSGEVRAALVDPKGAVTAAANHKITTWNPEPNHYQQSSEEIWTAVSTVVKTVAQSVDKSLIKGIGFTATCSLVAIAPNNRPLSVSLKGEKEQNIIMWMDHRASAEAAAINATGHPMLKYVGGKISLEMQPPKLLWLKKHLPHVWAAADRFFDLPDFLTWRATGSDSRSLCSVVCKWLYEATDSGVSRWNTDLYNSIGLGDLLDNDFYKIGRTVLKPGEAVGGGLSAESAAELGLEAGTPVAASIIDAHAGGLGLIGSQPDFGSGSLFRRLCVISGTSTCVMGSSSGAVEVAGTWGPYWSAMVPGAWLTEAGQSATGALLDHLLSSHPAFPGLPGPPGSMVARLTHLNSRLREEAGPDPGALVDTLTADLHVWPDFHGNRSPLADPSSRGMVCGLELRSDAHQLALLYLATVQALAYGVRMIVERMETSGYPHFEVLMMCGGLSKNPLIVQTTANVLGRPVLCPHNPESVLLGAAMLAAAAGPAASLHEAIAAMAGPAHVTHPQPEVSRYHEKKYQVFLELHKLQVKYRQIMSSP